MYAEPGPIKPLALPGQYVLLVVNAKYHLYRVAFYEPLIPSHVLVANVGALAAGVVSPPFNTNALLDMQEGTLANYRARVLDDIHVQIFEPQGLGRFQNLNVVTRLNLFNAMEDPCSHLSETAIMAQDRIFLVATNPTQYAITQARVEFWGFKHVLSGKDGVLGARRLDPIEIFDDIDAAYAKGIPFTVVPIGGWNR